MISIRIASFQVSSRVSAAMVLLGATVLPRVADAQSPALNYQAIDLGVFPGDRSSVANDLNNGGDVVGGSVRDDPLSPARIAVRAVVWRKGAVEDLGKLPAPYDHSATAYAVNQGGAVVGYSESADFISHAFLWRNGAMTDLGTFGGPSSSAVAINDHDQIVGWAETTAFYEQKGRRAYVRHAFLWERGVMQDLGTLGCGAACVNDFSNATDINDAGEITGIAVAAPGSIFGFIWSHGTMTPLTGLATLAFNQVEVAGINNRGDAVGTDDMQNDTPILWPHGGQAISLAQTCAGLGPTLDINNSGAILSYGNHSPVTPFFVPQVCVRQTVAFLPPVGPESGDNIPHRMNDSGAVVGSGNLISNNAYLATHAVLWVPDRPIDSE
jgi:probable HAF family extracellular repeat protein